MGTSIAMIDLHYGHLAVDRFEHAVSLLDALALERAVDAFAAFALTRFAGDCHRLQPRGSIKAPSFVVRRDDCDPAEKEQPRPRGVTGRPRSRTPPRCA
jgi:hypothetical protein